MASKKTIIESPLSPEEFFAQLQTSDLFVGDIKITHFEIREKVYFRKKFALPIIKGQIEKEGNNTKIIVSFTEQNSSRIPRLVFLFIIVFLAIFLGIYSQDILLSGAIYGMGSIISASFMLEFTSYCKRGLKKILKLTNSKIIK
jgi:hypothetical protein